MGWSPPRLSTAGIELDVSRLVRAGGAVSRASSSTPAWRLDGVTAGPADLLEDVDVAASAGEVVALMGRNGSGKTTLLRVIAGLVAPRSGSVSRSAGRVAYLPQNPAALLHRESVAAEVAWPTRASPAMRPTSPR